jgi:hypothetical protein
MSLWQFLCLYLYLQFLGVTLAALAENVGAFRRTVQFDVAHPQPRELSRRHEARAS